MENRLAQGTAAAMSRIESDTEALKRLKASVDSITDRIIKNARALGYFESPKDSPAAVPSAVVMTLSDAIRDLERSIEHASAALNVFD